jgi:replicative DNA helicase
MDRNEELLADLLNPNDVVKPQTKYIFDAKELVEEAADRILDFKSGKLKPIKFKKQFVNQALLGGLFPGTVFGIAGSSGHGKTTLMQELEDDILNKELNPDCDNYVVLKNNYEMSVFKLFLRALKNHLDKKISDLLGTNPFTEDEQNMFNAIKERESDPRIKYFQNPTDPETWFKVVEAFIIANQHKTHIVITIDHIALVKQTYAGKKDAIDNLIEHINYLKNKYNNVSFIILSQLNREIESRDNAKHSAPRKGDLYQSDFLYQLSDVILVVHNPFKLGLTDHMVVYPDMYTIFNQYKNTPDKKSSTFKTKGLIFYHFIKLREDENQSVLDLWIEPLQKSELKPSMVTTYQDYGELPKFDATPEIFGRYDIEEEDDPFK